MSKEQRSTAKSILARARSRRAFLRDVAVGGFGASLLGLPLARLALAEDAGSPIASVKDRFYIFVYFAGGWDTLISLDPRDPAVFTAGKLSKTHIQPGYELLDDPPGGGKRVAVKDKQGKTVYFGPYIGDLAKHFGKVSVVRGMSMDTLTHEVGRRRFLTGKPPSGLLARGSSGATWLASKLGAEQTIANLAVRVETYNFDQPNYASGMKVGSVPDLLRALKPDPSALPANIGKLIDLTLQQEAACAHAQASPTWMQAASSRIKARQMVNGGLDKLFNFQAKTAAMAKLREHYGIAAYGKAALATPEAQGAMAVNAITAGVSRVCSIQVPIIDAHYDDWATDHGPQQQRGFNLIARMLEDLEQRPWPGGGSWLDHTTIVGFSEFGRTSMVNQRGGRDHALTNACMLAGAGIDGGRIIGKSADVAMAPTPTNLLNGQTDNAKGEVIKPEHIYRALLWDVGVTADVADLRVPPLKALLSKKT